MLWNSRLGLQLQAKNFFFASKNDSSLVTTHLEICRTTAVRDVLGCEV